jgi:hypothetical protein
MIDCSGSSSSSWWVKIATLLVEHTLYLRHFIGQLGVEVLYNATHLCQQDLHVLYKMINFHSLTALENLQPQPHGNHRQMVSSWRNEDKQAAGTDIEEGLKTTEREENDVGITDCEILNTSDDKPRDTTR